MLHYNDSNLYNGKLQELNLRTREKQIKKSGSTAILLETSKTIPSMRALKRLNYDKPSLNK